jgi:hypothetical protein
MRMQTAALAVGLLCSAVLMASCDRQTGQPGSTTAACLSSLKKKPNTVTRLLSGQEIESCIRGKKVGFYSDEGFYYMNQSENFVSDGEWVVNISGDALDMYVGKWNIDHDKVCTKQTQLGVYCRAILLNQNDKRLFMRRDNNEPQWTRIIIGSSPYEEQLQRRDHSPAS